MRLYRIVAITAAALMTGAVVSAQSAEPISIENATRLVQETEFNVPQATHIGWSPLSDALAVASPEGVRFYNPAAWNALPRRLTEVTFPVTDFAYTPDGATLATASGSSIRLWDVVTGTETAHYDGTEPVAFSADGDTLAFGVGGVDLALVDMATGEQRAVSTGHSDRITDVAFSPAEVVFGSTSIDTTLRYWDEETGEPIGFQRSRQHPLLALDISPNGALIASGAREGMMRLLNLAMTTEATVSLRTRDDVTSVDFSDQTGQVLFSVGPNIGLWETGTRRPAVLLQIGSTPLTQAVFSPDGTRIATLDTSGTVRVFSVVSA